MTMSKRLYVDIKEDCNLNLTGPIKFPADGLFVFESLLLVIEEFAKAMGKPASEIIQDLYSFQKKQEREQS